MITPCKELTIKPDRNSQKKLHCVTDYKPHPFRDNKAAAQHSVETIFYDLEGK